MIFLVKIVVIQMEIIEAEKHGFYPVTIIKPWLIFIRVGKCITAHHSRINGQRGRTFVELVAETGHLARRWRQQNPPVTQVATPLIMQNFKVCMNRKFATIFTHPL